jgi:L-arabinose isomerase
MCMFPPRLGLFGIGLEAYWPQFIGLKERLEGQLEAVCRRLKRPGIELVNLGLIDTPKKALEAGHRVRREDLDLIFLYVTTYALSSTVLPVVQRARVPVIILNLAPDLAIDYAKFNRLNNRTAMTGEWLAFCSACPVPEIANVFQRAGVRFHQVTGVIDNDPKCWEEIDAWTDAARVASALSQNRLGLMGHYYGGMLDIYTDVTQLCATFGGHAELIEVDELSSLRREATSLQIRKRLDEFHGIFDVQPDCAPAELEQAARTSVALDRLVETHELGSFAYFYSGSGNPEHEDTLSSIILGNSLLTARGIPVAGEYEVKNACAMKVLDSFGVGGSFTEFYAMDFNDDVVLMGHDGPGHIAIAEGRTKVRPLQVYHGKIGKGLSVEMSVKHGPVTLLSIVESKSRGYEFLVAHAESVSGPILEIGNTNSRYRFPMNARDFINAWSSQGPAHHCAVGIGHIAHRIDKLGKLLGIETVCVC